MLQLREFECLIALSEHLHFGRAARSLQISQSRMSQTIQEIERRVGCQLFERTSRRVELTPEGKTLLDRIRPSYDQMRDSYRMAVAEIRSVKAVIRLGFTAAACRPTSDLLRTLRKQAPEYHVVLRELTGALPLAALQRGEVDAALTTGPVSDPELMTGPVIAEEKLVLAVPRDHVLAGYSSVTVVDFERDTQLRAPGFGRPTEDGFARPASIVPTLATGDMVRTWHELMALVAAGKGVATLAGSIAENYGRPDVRFVPVRGVPSLVVALVWRHADRGGVLIKTLLTCSPGGEAHDLPAEPVASGR